MSETSEKAPDAEATAVPPKIIPRKRRKQIDHSDPNHRCSPNHVRVPAHCRLKRFQRKRAKREMEGVLATKKYDVGTV